MLEHVTGNALDDRAARRAQRAAGREAPFTLARELVGDVPWVEAWLDGVRRSGVLARTADPTAAVRRAVETLARLPTSIARTELAVAVGGGAHALDDGSTVAALVLRALAARLGRTAAGDDGRAPGPVGAVRGARGPGVHDLPHPRAPCSGRRPRSRSGWRSPQTPAIPCTSPPGICDGSSCRRRTSCWCARTPACWRPWRNGAAAASLRCARAGSRRSSCWTSCTLWPARGCATTATSTGRASRSRTGSSRRSGWFRGGWGRPVPRRTARPASAPSRDADRADMGPRARRGDAPPRSGGARGGRSLGELLAAIAGGSTWRGRASERVQERLDQYFTALVTELSRTRTRSARLGRRGPVDPGEVGHNICLRTEVEALTHLLQRVTVGSR